MRVIHVASGLGGSRQADTEVFGRTTTAASMQGEQRVTGQAAGSVWPSASPPAASPALTWSLHDVAELPGVRAQLRRQRASGSPTPTSSTS